MVLSCPLSKGHDKFTSYAMMMPFLIALGSWFQLTLTEVGAMVMATTLLGAPLGTPSAVLPVTTTEGRPSPTDVLAVT